MKKPSILILESDEIFRRELKGELLHRGYEVIETGDVLR
jgi:ActR/RegA family two-component response regulator